LEYPLALGEVVDERRAEASVERRGQRALVALVDLEHAGPRGNAARCLRVRAQVLVGRGDLAPEPAALAAGGHDPALRLRRAPASRPPRAPALPSSAPSPSAPIRRWTTTWSTAGAAGAAATSSGRVKGRAPATAAATASPASAARSASASKRSSSTRLTCCTELLEQDGDLPAVRGGRGVEIDHAPALTSPPAPRYARSPAAVKEGRPHRPRAPRRRS